MLSLRKKSSHILSNRKHILKALNSHIKRRAVLVLNKNKFMIIVVVARIEVLVKKDLRGS